MWFYVIVSCYMFHITVIPSVEPPPTMTSMSSNMIMTMLTSTTPSPESTRESRGIVVCHVIHYNEFIY